MQTEFFVGVDPVFEIREDHLHVAGQTIAFALPLGRARRLVRALMDKIDRHDAQAGGNIAPACEMCERRPMFRLELHD